MFGDIVLDELSCGWKRAVTDRATMMFHFPVFIQLTLCAKVRLVAAFSADVVPYGVENVLLFGFVRTEESLAS